MRIIIEKLCFSILFLFNFAYVLFAQIEYVEAERLSIAHELSSNDVRCLLQDRKGFLWIGTINGLNRYDGYRFKIFRNDPSSEKSTQYLHDPNDPNSLSGNASRAIERKRA